MSDTRIGELWDTCQYVTEPTEWRSRGLSLIDSAKREGQSLWDYINSNPINDAAFADMRPYATPRQIYNYASQALGVSAPIGVSLKMYTSSNDKSGYHKQGGQIKYFYD